MMAAEGRFKEDVVKDLQRGLKKAAGFDAPIIKESSGSWTRQLTVLNGGKNHG